MRYYAMLVDQMQKESESIESIATVVGTSKTTVTRFLNQSRQVAPEIAASIVRHLLPKYELDFMGEFVLTLTRPENIRKSLEYCSVNRMFDQMKELLVKAETDRNGTVQEAYEVYSLIYRMQKGELTSKQVYDIVRCQKASLPEHQILLRIIELCSIYNQGEYSWLMASKGSVEEDLQNLDESYLKSSFQCRLNEVMSAITLRYLNKPKNARSIAKRILNEQYASVSAKASAYSRVSASFLLKDYDRCVKYALKAQKLYARVGREDVVEILEYNIQFASLLWGKSVDVFVSQDLRALSLSKAGETDSAMFILTSLDDKEGTMSALREFYKGEVTADPKYYYNSMHMFMKKGDRYMAELSRIKLLNLGQPDYIVNAMFVA